MGQQKDVGICCFCIPLRTGVSLLCLYHFLFGVVCLLNIFYDDVRFQSGGYNPYTNKLQVCVGCLGMGFALIGLLGLYDNKVDWIRTYNYFQITKLVTLGVVFFCDQVYMARCERFVFSIESQQLHNPTMSQISTKNLCGAARQAYTLGFVIDFAFNMYFTYVSYYYCAALMMSPAYIIAFGDQGEKGETHMQVRFFDYNIGEPGAYLDSPSKTPQEVYGAGYGSLPAERL